MRYLKLKHNPLEHTGLVLICLFCITSITACRQDMHDQPKYEPYEMSSFFDDRRTSRVPVEGTIASAIKTDRIDMEFFMILRDRPD